MCAIHPLHGRIRAHACVKGHSHAHDILVGTFMGDEVDGCKRHFTDIGWVDGGKSPKLYPRGNIASNCKPGGGAYAGRPGSQDGGAWSVWQRALPHKSTLPTVWAAFCARRAVERCQASARVPWMPSHGPNIGRYFDECRRAASSVMRCYTCV